jgi:hypothetical protein
MRMPESDGTIGISELVAMDDVPERLRERGQRNDVENPRQGEDESAAAEVTQPAQADTIVEPGVTRVHRDPKDDGQMHD